jgi:hypothetical protein
MNIEGELTELHAKLGHKWLSRTFAKLEIFVGLGAVSAGLWLNGGMFAPVLFALGGYLALAGHRSHIYQSNNELAAYLAGEIRNLKQTAIQSCGRDVSG